MNRRWLLPAGVVLAIAAGCSSSRSGTSGGAGPQSQPRATTETVTVTKSQGGGGTTAGASVAQVPKRLAPYCGGRACDDFATPSSNITCFAAGGRHALVECRIRSGLKPLPTTTPPC